MEQAATLQFTWMDAVRAPLVLLRGGFVVRANQHLENLCRDCCEPSQPFLRHIVPDQQTQVAEFIERADASADMICMFQTAHNGHRVRITCALVPELGDDLRLVTMTSLETHDEREREREARESLLKTIMFHLPLSVFAIDAGGTLLFEDARGTPIEGLFSKNVGMSIYDLHADEADFLEDTQRVLEGETIERERVHNGYVYDTYYAPILDAQGSVIGAVGMGIDITDRLRMQQSAIETDRLRITLQKEVELSEMKTKIMRRIAHEFRTPLSTIQLSAQMLERYQDRLSSAERSVRIENILRETRHITRLLDDIAHVVKSQAQHVQLNVCSFNLTSLCQMLIEEIRTSSAAQHYWAVSIDADVEQVNGDSRLIGIMVQNLLSNAATFSEPGTVIKLNVWREAGQLFLRVTDQGIGILPEELSQVFEVFFRGSNFDERPGLGLGLSLVHDAVEQHGGKISIESTPGTGTTVTITLPQ